MKMTRGEKAFSVFNTIFLVTLALLCLLPLINLLSISFSSKSAIMSGKVSLFPVEFTAIPYKYVLNRPQFWRAFGVGVKRVALGATINIVLLMLLAYPLSKDNSKFFGRTFYAWYFFVTMLFSGGLIPGYALLNDLKLLDTIWALVLPKAVPIFSLVLMINFFRRVPIELEEAAFIDGASHFYTLVFIYIPVSIPSIATILLFSIITHWNSWFDGLIFMNHTENYPLQSYLQTIIISFSQTETAETDWRALETLIERNIKCAQIVVGTLPILLVYPALQRYFVTGIVLGSVKG